MAHRKGVENDGPTRILRNGTPCYITFYYVLPFGSLDHLFVLFDFMKCCMTNEHNFEERVLRD